MDFRRAPALALGVAALAMLPYLAGYPGRLEVPDLNLILNHPTLEASSLKRAFVEPSLSAAGEREAYQPITEISFILQARHGRFSPASLFTVNVLGHGAAALFCFLLAFSITRSFFKALPAGLAFGLLPIQALAVNCASYRPALLAAGFSLAAMTMMTHALKRPGRLIHFLWFAVLCFLALGSGAEALPMIVLPAMMALTLPRKEFSGSGRGLIVMLGLAAAGAFLILAKKSGAGFFDPSLGKMSALSLLADRLWSLVEALKLAAWPGLLAPVHDLSAPGSGPVRTGILAAGVLVLLVLSWRVRGRHPLFFLGTAWFLLGLVFRPAGPSWSGWLSEEQVYFSMAGLSLVAGEALGSWFEAAPGAAARRGVKPKAAAALFLIVCALWSSQVVLRCRQWLEEERLWTIAVKRAPENASGFYWLGRWRLAEGDPDRSRQMLERVLSLLPDDISARTWLGRIEVNQGRFREAVELLEPVIDESNCDPEAHYDIARAYLGLERVNDAEQQFLLARQLMPDHIGSCEGLLSVYIYHLRDFERAREVIKQCLLVNPTPEQYERMKGMMDVLIDEESRSREETE